MMCKGGLRLLLGAILALACVQVAGAQEMVGEGWDLLDTTDGTQFFGTTFTGVPLEEFDFGGTIGVQNTGDTDTIVQRLEDASSPGPAPIDIELVALQLKSATTINTPVCGPGIYYVTLQKDRGPGDPPPGPPSTGTMDIEFSGSGGGTFDSSIDVFFDLRLGGLDGLICLEDQKTLTSTGTEWTHEAPEGVLTIEDVNNLLNGSDESWDFWPDLILEDSGDGEHVVESAGPGDADDTPAIGGVGAALLLLAVAGIGTYFIRRLVTN